MLLYLFCLKVYFIKSEQIDVKKSMFQNVIELGKSECNNTLFSILESINITNIEGKGNPGGNLGKGNQGGKEGKNKSYK